MIWVWLAVACVIALPLMPIRRLTPAQLAWSRDRWLVGVCGVAVVWLGTYEIALAALALAALAQWKGPAQMATMILWAAVIGAWFIVASLPLGSGRWLGYGFMSAALLHAGICCLWQRVDGRIPVRGWLGQRTISAMALVLALPFTWLWLALPVLAGILVTESWLGWIAAAAALGMLQPWTLLLSAGLAAILLPPIISVARLLPLLGERRPGMAIYDRVDADRTWLDRVSYRGPSIDSLRTRLLEARMLLGALSWRGSGPGSVQRLMARSATPHAGHAHCEPLAYVVEYGLLGAVALVLMAWRVVPHLRLGDPWSAAVVAGAVLMLGSYPAHVPQVGGLWWAQVTWVATR